MNRIFNVIWSITREKWVVVSEKIKSNGGVPKSSLLSIVVLSSILAAGVPAYAIDPGALPAGGQITAGAGSIGSSGTRMTVNQSSQQMIANWSSFNIGTDASVQFIQPNVSATVLNRIADQNPSQILGSLSANGKVFLLNQSGIIFGKNALVDVGALVASSLNMLDSDFLAGRYKFTNSGNAGEILNQGSINVTPGGVVALIAPKVTNEGAITARSGSVAFGAGNKVSVDFTGDGLITLTVDEGAIEALVENKGLVKADGGVVIMTAKAADALSQSVVNNSGIIQANTLQQQGGRILLDAVGGMTTVSGTLDVSSVDGKGGQVVATGDRVLVTDGAHLTASGATGGGEVLVGGNWQGKDTSLHQATGTIVEPGALLEANATDTGNGGTVVAWSDVTNPLSVTRAYGTFEAKGGPNGGDGGRIETSGHWLDVAGSQGEASAAHGQGGLWFFDPYDVTISLNPSVFDPGVSVDSDWKWTSNESGTVISVVSITFNLTSGTNVTIETGGDFGNITLDTPISDIFLPLPFNATLKLSANGSIILNQDISTVGSLNLEFDTVKGGVSGTGNISGYGDTIFKIGGNSTYTGTISDGVSFTGPPLVRTLTKDGAGILTLTATNNYTGTTTINAGAIRVSGATAALGDTVNGGAPVTVVSGAALELDNVSIDNYLDLQGTLSSVSGDNIYGGYISLSGAPYISADSGTKLTLSYDVDRGGNSTGDLTVTGSGTVVFNGRIGSEIPITSFTGDAGTTVEINGGLLNTSGAQTFHGQTTFRNVDGTLLQTSNNNITADGSITATAGLLTLDTGIGEINLANLKNDFFTILVTRAGTVTLIDANALTLSGILATGPVNVATLTDDLTIEGNIDNGNFATDVSVTLSANNSIQLNQDIVNNSYSGKLNLEFDAFNGGVWGKGNISGDGATIFNVGGDSTFEGTIKNGINITNNAVRSFTKTGGGTLTLQPLPNSSNSYTGDTTVFSGTLKLGASDVIPYDSNLVVDGSGIFDIGINDNSVKTVTVKETGSIIGTGTLSSGSYTIDNDSDTSISAILADVLGDVNVIGVLTKLGTGTLTLSGANTYTGSTSIHEGTIRVSNNTALGDVNSGWVEVFSGAVLALDNVAIVNNNLYLTNDDSNWPAPALSNFSGNSTYGGYIYLSGKATINVDSGTLILSNPVYGSCDLNVSGSGSVIFNGEIGNTDLPLDSVIGGKGVTLFINGGAVTTNGSQTYHDAVILGADTGLSGSDITFDSVVKSDVTSDSNFMLTVSDLGTTTFGGAVGGSSAGEELSSLFIKSDGGTAINGGAVTTTGFQTYYDIVTLGANTTLTGANIRFVSEVKSSGGNHSLKVIDSGKTIFGGPVGGSSAGEELLSLETFGSDPVLYGSVTTTGAQIYHDIVTLGTDIVLTGDGIRFDYEIQSSDGYVSLTVYDSGATFFGGAVGGINSGEELSSLDVFSSAGTTINGGSVKTIGAQTYNNSAIFAAGTTLSTVNSDITAIGSVTATGLLTLDAGIGKVTFKNQSNDFLTVLVTSAGTVSLTDSNALTISGIQATGPVSVATRIGNLTVEGDIYTSDNSAIAIQLNAGEAAVAGNSSGGNIIILGSPTISTGDGGFATLYTGSVSGSTGVSELVGTGSERFRYSSDELVKNYSLPLTPGLNAVYRELSFVIINLKVDEELLNPSDTAPPDDPVTGDVVSVINPLDSEIVYDLETGDGGYLLDAPGTVIVGDLSMGYVVNMPASGVISGIGSLTKVGVGPLLLSRINTFGGGKIITGAAPGIGVERGGITAIGAGSSAGAASRDANQNAAYSDLIHKILVTGGSLIIFAGGALLLSRTRRFSHKATFGKHANVYAHIHHGYQHINADILPKDLAGKKEVSVRIQHDIGIQEVQVRGGSLVNSD